mmetsp:Transcript_33853/g.80414  ORF Transcript_33853/g.80414 Transcript_33853/m.80414 type:complete len:203 (-) Transcript_33853:750-1358(-)
MRLRVKVRAGGVREQVCRHGKRVLRCLVGQRLLVLQRRREGRGQLLRAQDDVGREPLLSKAVGALNGQRLARLDDGPLVGGRGVVARDDAPGKLRAHRRQRVRGWRLGTSSLESAAGTTDAHASGTADEFYVPLPKLQCHAFEGLLRELLWQARRYPIVAMHEQALIERAECRSEIKDDDVGVNAASCPPDGMPDHPGERGS